MDQACHFRVDGSGGPARAPRGRDRCAFCDRDYMALLCADNEIVGVLQKLKRFPEDLQQKGLEYIPEDKKEWFQEKLAKIKHCGGLDGEPCTFGPSDKGKPARVRKQCTACDFCDRGKLEEICPSPAERYRLKMILGKMSSASKRKAIEERIPADQRSHFLDMLPGEDPHTEPPPDAGPRARARKRPASQAHGEDPAGAATDDGPETSER